MSCLCIGTEGSPLKKGGSGRGKSYARCSRTENPGIWSDSSEPQDLFGLLRAQVISVVDIIVFNRLLHDIDGIELRIQEVA